MQRVRLEADEVEPRPSRRSARCSARAAARGAEWELGESCTPADLVERLGALGIVPDEDEPVAIGMVLAAGAELAAIRRAYRPAGSPRSTSSSRRVGSSTRRSAATPTRSSFEQAEADFATEGTIGSTFLAFVDGEPVAAGYASYTPLGLLLFGGATLPSARGRGAYRALVAARAREAAARGTPVLVTHAGQMSRPILERLGFTPVARIDRLLDVSS